MFTADFDFPLPPELIAQHPAEERDRSRLLVFERPGGAVMHRSFQAFPSLLRPGDLLVLNDSRVIPARLRAINPETGGAFEILLFEENGINDWWAMMRPAKRARVGTSLSLLSPDGLPAGGSVAVTETNAKGHRRLKFSGYSNIAEALEELGEVPLPPYISRAAGPSTLVDRQRYQTVYARDGVSVAAPTAGLHFTNPLLEEIRKRAVEIRQVTLHVGLGTFAPVKADRPENHHMHFERFHVSAETAEAINRAKAEGRRVIAVGTTSVRVLETLGREQAGHIVGGAGRTNIFIFPPYRFRVVDALLTNFHLPQSTLLMLVSAFATPGELRGRELILAAYQEAIRERYRFFSYGDAMFIT